MNVARQDIEKEIKELGFGRIVDVSSLEAVEKLSRIIYDPSLSKEVLGDLEKKGVSGDELKVGFKAFCEEFKREEELSEEQAKQLPIDFSKARERT